MLLEIPLFPRHLMDMVVLVFNFHQHLRSKSSIGAPGPGSTKYWVAGGGGGGYYGGLEDLGMGLH